MQLELVHPPTNKAQSTQWYIVQLLQTILIMLTDVPRIAIRGELQEDSHVWCREKQQDFADMT